MTSASHICTGADELRTLFRSHGGRRLDAADVGRAGRAHPRHRARRPRRDAQHAAVVAARETCAARRILDAGCGTGRALDRGCAARRATWSAIDLSPTLVELARERAPRRSRARAQSTFTVGDMLDPALGRFDYVVAMDQPDPLRRAGHRAHDGRPGRDAPTIAILFTFAPRTPALTVMHAVGRLFPRGDRAPAIAPISRRTLRAALRRSTRLSKRWQHRRAAAASPAASTYRRHWRLTPRMNRRVQRSFGERLDAARAPLAAVRRRGDRGAAAVAAAAAVAVSGHGRHGRRAADRHAQSRDDRRARRPALLVVADVSLPLVFAPFRALIGFRSDNHRSVLGWRRVPYIWMGTLLQFGGFAIMPFALLVLSGDTTGPIWVGQFGAALAFLAGRRGPAYDADRRPRAGDRPCAASARARASSRSCMRCCCSAWRSAR